MAVITVADRTELRAALDAAAGGERIELLPGSYGRVDIRERRFDTPVTLASADADDPAVFDTLRVHQSAGLRFEGIDALPEAVRPLPWDPVVHVTHSERISIADMRVEGVLPDATSGVPATSVGVSADRNAPITGYGQGIGIWLGDSSEVEVDGVEVSHLATGITLFGLRGARVANAHIHDIRVDGIGLSNVADVVIEDNLLHSFRAFGAPSAPGIFDHGDFIAFFAGGAPNAVDGLTIRGNVLLQGTGGPTQALLGGLMLQHPGAATTPVDDIRIHDNVIHHTHTHGLSINDVRGAEIFNNTLLPAPDNPVYVNVTAGIPRIRLFSSGSDPDFSRPPTGVRVEDNRVVDLAGQGAADLARNTDFAAQDIVVSGNEVLSPDPSAPDWWGHTFPGAVDAIKPSAADFRIGEGEDGARALAPWIVAWLDDPAPISDTFLKGGGADDRLVAGAANHTLIGGGGDDRLEGGAGWDTLHGGPGDDTLSGGAGGDVFALRPHPGDRDRIVDLDFAAHDYVTLVDGFPRNFFSDAVDPDNALTLMPFAAGAHLLDAGDLAEVAAHGRVEARAAGPDAVTLAFDLDGDGDWDAADWSLTLDGVTGIGEARPAADPIAGGPGDDRIAGGAGDDVLAAGPGRDTLSGGAGADIFRLDAGVAGPGADLVADLDFGAGDRLDFAGLGEGLGAGGSAIVGDLPALAALVAEGAETARLAAREIAGATDLLFDADGDGHAEWTLRLDGVTGVVAAAPPALAAEPAAPLGPLLPAAPDEAGPALRLPPIDPWVLELMGG